MWDWVSGLVGLLIGMIIMIIVFWATYHTRTFIFTVCPKNVPTCLYDQYWNDPGNALAENTSLTASDILFIDNNQRMLYKRVPKTSACIPVAATQSIEILNPQVCQFSTQAGTITPDSETFQARNGTFESPLYAGTLSDGTVINVLTDGNCQAIRSETRTTPPQDIVSRGGTPVVQWAPNPRITETSFIPPPPPTLGL